MPKTLLKTKTEGAGIFQGHVTIAAGKISGTIAKKSLSHRAPDTPVLSFQQRDQRDTIADKYRRLVPRALIPILLHYLSPLWDDQLLILKF